MKPVHLAWGLWIIAIVAIFMLGYCTIANAEELPQAISMKTDVGEVVLENYDCDVINSAGFEFRAYATEGELVHKGCWYVENGIVNIWFYEESPKLVATYRDYYFKPRGLDKASK